MISNPKYGWATISINDWVERCSYIDDVPFLLLEALESTCRTLQTSVVSLDAEGYHYYMVFDLHITYIINSKDSDRLTVLDVGAPELSVELLKDIRGDLDAWSSWVDYGDMSDDKKAERAKDLAVLCNILERRLEQWPKLKR